MTGVSGEVIVAPTSRFVFVADDYGRESVDQLLVGDYVEALRGGAQFPPIEVYADNQIAGGVHRWQAHDQLGLDIAAVVIDEPEGISRKVHSAALNRANGQRQPRAELQALAFDEVKANPNVSVEVLADALGVSSSTVARWTGPLRAAQDLQRRLTAAILADAGWTQTKIAAEVGVARQTVTDWMPDLPKWVESASADVEAAVAAMSDDASEASAAVVAEWRERETLAASDKRDAERLRMAVGGWSQLKGFRDHSRRAEVLALLTDHERKVLKEMESRIHV